MEIANRLSHGKRSEAPLSMDLLHEAKTGLEFGLQVLKCLRLPLRSLLSCRDSFQHTLLLDMTGDCHSCIVVTRYRLYLLTCRTAIERGPLDLLNQVGDRNPSRAAFGAIEHRTAAKHA
jgi:hypothetical protein